MQQKLLHNRTEKGERFGVRLFCPVISLKKLKKYTFSN